MGLTGRKQTATCPSLGFLKNHAPPRRPGASPWPDPAHRKEQPAQVVGAADLVLALGLFPLILSVMLSWPSGYFFSSGGMGRALGGGSGSQSRNSWSNVLTVSGHSNITMWLPSSMSFRKARSKICRGNRLRVRCPASYAWPATLGSLLQSTFHPSISTQKGIGGWSVALLGTNSVFIHSTFIKFLQYVQNRIYQCQYY